jgi:hypothetical protein
MFLTCKPDVPFLVLRIALNLGRCWSMKLPQLSVLFTVPLLVLWTASASLPSLIRLTISAGKNFSHTWPMRGVLFAPRRRERD